MRIEKVMNVAIAREVEEHLERRLLVLATVGSAGPFIGLFGTVGRHYDEFPVDRGVAKRLASGGRARHRGIVFATAIGLVAAIPATIFYNKFVSEVNRQAQRLEGCRRV